MCSASTIPGSAWHTQGMALTARIAVASTDRVSDEGRSVPAVHELSVLKTVVLGSLSRHRAYPVGCKTASTCALRPEFTGQSGKMTRI
jgi:hypothetical protein